MNIPVSGAQKGNCDVICRCMNISVYGANKGNEPSYGLTDVALDVMHVDVSRRFGGSYFPPLWSKNTVFRDAFTAYQL
jgi:hypothetical protein